MANYNIEAFLKEHEQFEGSLREAAKAARPQVTPHWQDNSAAFWYLKDTSSGGSEFIYADARTGVRRPAFDHNHLAGALSQALRRHIEAQKLPFDSIDLSQDGSSVRFRVDDQKWEFTAQGKLSPYGKEIDEAQVEILAGEENSESRGGETSITFVNRRNYDVGLHWISFEGQSVSYNELKPGGSTTQHTFEGHVWKVTGRKKETLVVCRAIRQRATLVIDDSLTGKPQLEVLDGDAPSMNAGGESTIKFRNTRKHDVSLLWNDFDGNSKKYASLGAGESSTQSTYLGHVWKVTGKKGKVYAIVRSTQPKASFKIDKSLESRYGHDEESDGPVFVDHCNVWYNDPSGKKVQISRDGTGDRPYDPGHIYASPDKRMAVVWQYTPEQEHLIHLVESSPKDQLEPKHETKQYLKPGDRIRQDRPKLFNLERRCEISTNSQYFDNPWEVQDIGWTPDSREYRFYYNQRGHQCVRVLGMAWDGSVRVLVEEVSKTFIDYSQKTYRRLISSTNEMIWASERDGRNHLYLVDLHAGLIKNQITWGEYIVKEVSHVDENQRRIWLKVLALHHQEDPYYIHLARTNFDGSGFTILTDGDGTHKWEFSPDRRLLIDTYSRVDLPPTTLLRDAETGRPLMNLEQGDLQPLLTLGWTPPERFVAPGRDGRTPIHGIIFRPWPFDASLKYPVVEDIYAGPHGHFVPKEFDVFLKQNFFTRQGVVVVQIDGMGTNWRAKAFHDVAYKNLRDAGFPDRKVWIQQAGRTRSWMDTERVGVWGNSAGGQSACSSLIFHDGFYKAAVADCGCHDNRMDKIWWNEAWMGWPIDKSYEENSNAVHAEKLRGALMLMVGEMDRNVDPSSTLQVVNALNKAKKYYELMVFPGCDHGEGSGSLYGKWRMVEFFRRHLGVGRPHGQAVSQQPPQQQYIRPPPPPPNPQGQQQGWYQGQQQAGTSQQPLGQLGEKISAKFNKFRIG